MNKYESVIIINPVLDEKSIKELAERFSKIISENGKVTKLDFLGKKKLAYEIRKNNEGYFLVLYFDANSNVISELERNYRITDDVIKFMTIKVNE